jgi:hypothetical protein
MGQTYGALESRLLAWIGDPAREDFEEILLEIHAFQQAANPAYRRYCERLPAAQRWTQIPALPQQVFKHGAVRCFDAAETARTFRTSGTTGEGWGEHHFKSLALYEAAARAGWRRAGLAAEGILPLVAPAAEAPFSSLSQMASWLAPEFFVRAGAGCWDALAARLAGARGPVVLFGTALAFLDWFERLGERTLSLPPGSLAVETGGYKGTRRQLAKEELYALFGARLGLRPESVVNEYGMTELSSQFYARGIGAPHRGPHWARAVVIDPESGAEAAEGATGVLRIYDAANLGSVCAVQTQDLAIRRGDEFELLGRDPAALPRGCSRAADESLVNGH